MGDLTIMIRSGRSSLVRSGRVEVQVMRGLEGDELMMEQKEMKWQSTGWRVESSAGP